MLMRFRISAATGTGSALAIWIIVAFGLKQIIIG
jgi:hypothetical protein